MFRNTQMRVLSALITVVVAIAGCGGTITLPGLNQSPKANAGADQTTDVGQRVTLDGLGSTNPDDDPLAAALAAGEAPSPDWSPFLSSRAGCVRLVRIASRPTDLRGHAC